MNISFDIAPWILRNYETIRLWVTLSACMMIILNIVIACIIGSMKKPQGWTIPTVMLIFTSITVLLSVFSFHGLLDYIETETLSTWSILLYLGIFFGLIFILLPLYVIIGILFRGSYKKRVLELRGRDLVIGIKKTWDEKNHRIIDPINPKFFIAEQDSFYTNWLILGGTGSGKTTGSVFKNLQQILLDTSKNRSAVLVLDIKGNMFDEVSLWHHPRKKDVRTVGYNYTPVNLLGADKSLKTADNLIKGFKSIEEDANSDRFYSGFQERFCRSAVLLVNIFANRNRDFDDILINKEKIDLNKPVNDVRIRRLSDVLSNNRLRNTKECTMQHIYDLAVNQELFIGLLSYVDKYQKSEHSKDEDPHTLQIAINEGYNLVSDKNFSKNVMGFLSDLSIFLDPQVKDYFLAEHSFSFKEMINEGQIVFVNVPQGEIGYKAAKMIALQFLLQFISALEKRNSSGISMNKTRTAFCIIDEASKFMCKELESATATCRSAKGSFWLLTQSETQFPEIYRNSLKGNLRSKMTFSIGDEETARSLVQLFGKSQQQRISRSKSKMGGGAGSMGRATSGESIQEDWQDMLHVSDFIELKPDHVFASYTAKKRTHPLQTVYVFPWFLPAFNMFPVHFVYGRCGQIQEERTRKFFTTLARTDTAVRIRKASFVNGYLFFAVCYYVDSYIDRTIKLCEETAKKTLNHKIHFYSFQGPLEDFYQKQEEVL